MEHNQAGTKQGQYEYQPIPSPSWEQNQQQQSGPLWQQNQQSLQYNKKPWQQNQQPRKQNQHSRQQNQHLQEHDSQSWQQNQISQQNKHSRQQNQHLWEQDSQSWQQNQKPLQHSQQSWNQNQQLQQQSKISQQHNQQTRQQGQYAQKNQHQQCQQPWQQNQQSWQQNQSLQQFNKQQNKNQFQHQKQMSDPSTANQRLPQPSPFPHPIPNQTPLPQTNQTIFPPHIQYPYSPPTQSSHQAHTFQVPPPNIKSSQNFHKLPNTNLSNINQERVQGLAEQSFNHQQTASYQSQQRQFAYPPKLQDNIMELQNRTQNVRQTWSPVFQQPVSGEEVVELTQKEKDQQWINNFVLRTINVKETANQELKKQQIKIPQAKNMIRNYRHLLDDLKLQRDLLVENVDIDPETWQQALQQISEIKRKLKSVSEEITDPAFISKLTEKLKMRQKKTLNLKRRRQTDIDERQEYLDKIQEIDKKINANIEKAKKEKLEELKEKQLQKEIDTTLFEVRKKKKEADKTLEILRGLRKLRQVRKISSEQKGVVLPVSSETIFEQRITQMEQFMNRQRAVYTAEEQAMQVMLEEEQEETKEQERQMLQEKLKEKEMKQLHLRRKLLFGNENIDDPNLIPFNEFYKQSDVNMDAFLHVRYTWDQCLVLPNTDGSSSIPVAWVAPDPPSSRIWKTAVADSLD